MIKDLLAELETAGVRVHRVGQGVIEFPQGQIPAERVPKGEPFIRVAMVWQQVEPKRLWELRWALRDEAAAVEAIRLAWLPPADHAA